MELSQIRQAVDGRYSIPYKDPLNDYFKLWLVVMSVREFDGVGPGSEFDDRVCGCWCRTFN